MLSLSVVGYVEAKIAETRSCLVHLLAGDRAHERRVWNILLEITNDFIDPASLAAAPASDVASTSDEEVDAAASSASSIVPTARIVWGRYAGDVLLGLLVLAGADAKWAAPAASSATSSIAEVASTTARRDVPTLAQARLRRFLDPTEKEKCRCLFLRAVFGSSLRHQDRDEDVVFVPSCVARFDALVPLLLSFSSPRARRPDGGVSLSPPTSAAAATATTTTTTDWASAFHVPATSTVLRGVVAAAITTLAMQRGTAEARPSSPASDDGADSPLRAAQLAASGLYSLITSAVCDRANQPSDVALDCGLRIAEVLATPPVAHGWFDLSSGRWVAQLTASDVVAYFSSLLRQVGAMLVLLAPSATPQRAGGARSSPQPAAASRALCVCLFLVGRLAAATSPSAASAAASAAAPANQSSLVALLAALSRPRLALIDRELFGPSLAPLIGSAATVALADDHVDGSDQDGGLRQQLPSSSSSPLIERALLCLEGLLSAVHVLPTMVMTAAVERSLWCVVAIVWDRVGEHVVTLALLSGDAALSSSDDAAAVSGRAALPDLSKSAALSMQHRQRCLARSCVALLLGSLTESLSSSSSRASARAGGRGSSPPSSAPPVARTAQMLMLQPVVTAAVALCGSGGGGGGDGGRQRVSRSVDAVDRLVGIALDAAAMTSGARSTSPADGAAALALLFGAAVDAQRHHGRGSAADAASALFVVTLLARGAQLPELLAGAAMHGGAAGAVAMVATVLRFAEWTLTRHLTVMSDDGGGDAAATSGTSKASAGLALSALALIDALPPIDDVATGGYNASAVSAPVASEHALAEVRLDEDMLDDIAALAARLQVVVSKMATMLCTTVAGGAGGDGSSAVDAIAGGGGGGDDPLLLVSRVARSLGLMQRGCQLLSSLSASAASAATQAPTTDGDDGGDASAARFQAAFADARKLLDLRLWVALAVALADVAHRLAEFAARQSSARRRLPTGRASADHDVSVARADAALLKVRAVFRTEVRFVVGSVLSRGAKASSGNSSYKSRLTNPTTRPAPVATAAVDEAAVAAACSLLAMAALLRLDGERNEELRAALCAALGDAIARPDSDAAAAHAAAVLDVVVRIADDDLDGLTLRNVVFTAPPAPPPSSLTNVVASVGPASPPATAECLALQLVRAPASTADSAVPAATSDTTTAAATATAPRRPIALTFQALRLCCLHVLGQCYERVPRLCDFDTVADVVVGIFRSPGETAEADVGRRRDNQQLLRLAAAALLASVAPVAAAVLGGGGDGCGGAARADDIGEDSDDAARKKFEQLSRIARMCDHVSQYRSPSAEPQAFDEEIRAHGRNAAAGVKAACPELVLRAALQRAA